MCPRGGVGATANSESQLERDQIQLCGNHSLCRELHLCGTVDPDRTEQNLLVSRKKTAQQQAELSELTAASLPPAPGSLRECCAVNYETNRLIRKTEGQRVTQYSVKLCLSLAAE